jgi:6-pyruvoyltetrahydropterin/6-carboxytetrahydropterin synthase
MNQVTTIELYKENMKFSAGHFTIFSATEREPLHGHNYQVAVSLTNQVQANGLSFDYRFYKNKVYQLCRELNQTFLLPTQSAYLQIEEEGDYIYAHFAGTKLPFLKSDITLLPVCNVTVEELSRWLLERLIEDQHTLNEHWVHQIVVRVSSAPGQSGSATWTKPGE